MNNVDLIIASQLINAVHNNYSNNNAVFINEILSSRHITVCGGR